MLRRLSSGRPGLARITSHFGQMLEDARSVFDTAVDTLLAGTDPHAVAQRLYDTDKRINLLEQRIRRELVVHLSVSERLDHPGCLEMMSLVKDAERIGDDSKNLLDLGRACRDFAQDPQAADLRRYVDLTSGLLRDVRTIHENRDVEAAREFVDQAREVVQRCNQEVDGLSHHPERSERPVIAALAWRYLMRVTAHAMNIATSLLVPLDKLDYFDESEETRVPLADS